jgi:hypothetical protein
MGEITEGVNWLAVIVGFVLAWLLGWLWYSPKLFGTKWAAGKGVGLGSSSDMPVAAMVAQAIGTFLFAWVVGVTAKNEHLLTIILVILTIALLIMANGLFGKSSRYTIATEVGYVLAMAVVMIVVQGIF